MAQVGLKITWFSCLKPTPYYHHLGIRFPPYKFIYNLGTTDHSPAYLFLSCLAPWSKLTEKGVTAHTCLAECSCFLRPVANTFMVDSS